MLSTIWPCDIHATNHNVLSEAHAANHYILFETHATNQYVLYVTHNANQSVLFVTNPLNCPTYPHRRNQFRCTVNDHSFKYISNSNDDDISRITIAGIDSNENTYRHHPFGSISEDSDEDLFAGLDSDIDDVREDVYNVDDEEKEEEKAVRKQRELCESLSLRDYETSSDEDDR